MALQFDNQVDVMQVCRNGHVITDRLHGDPESGRLHCERCGAATLHRCLTCGLDIPGAGRVAALVTIGASRPPYHCPACGAVFPWTRRPAASPQPFVVLEQFLRRMPLVIRQLRWRQGERPPFRIEDERDLEDLVRSLLPLYFDEVRLESRTPRYSPVTRTDFLLPTEGIALTVKLARPTLRDLQLLEQSNEDVDYYRTTRELPVLANFVYDPEGRLRDTPLGSLSPDEQETPVLQWIVVT